MELDKLLGQILGSHGATLPKRIVLVLEEKEVVYLIPKVIRKVILWKEIVRPWGTGRGQGLA
jgi:hypothetical protein